MMNFQTEHLRTFLAVLEEGTFEAAAHRLHVTPSAISQRIKAMEQAAGQILVQRTSPISATPAGVIVRRLARQLRQLESDAAAELGLGASSHSTLTVVVNADSLATWFMQAIARLPLEGRATLELIREDEQHSVNLLHSGAAMAAVSATATPVQGCSSTPLGTMEYRAVAATSVMQKWFPQGFQKDTLAHVPVVQFDRTDTLQSNFLASVTGSRLTGPQHYIPDTLQFAEAVAMGLGWGLLPDEHCRAGLDSGALTELIPNRVSRIPLYWQRWKIQSTALDALSLAVTEAANTTLRQG